jgi:hypothetical protein
MASCGKVEQCNNLTDESIKHIKKIIYEFFQQVLAKQPIPYIVLAKQSIPYTVEPIRNTIKLCIPINGDTETKIKIKFINPTFVNVLNLEEYLTNQFNMLQHKIENFTKEQFLDLIVSTAVVRCIPSEKSLYPFATKQNYISIALMQIAPEGGAPKRLRSKMRKTTAKHVCPDGVSRVIYVKGHLAVKFVKRRRDDGTYKYARI